MRDTTQGRHDEQEATQVCKATEKPMAIRIKLKDKDYRCLCKVAREQGCRPEELVERCVRRLLAD